MTGKFIIWLPQAQSIKYLYHIRSSKDYGRRVQGYKGAPDWIVEIVSPSSRSMDCYKKLFKYRTAGVREYWVVDPDKQIVTVYSFEGDAMEEYSFGENVPVGIYDGFSIKVE